MGKHLNKLEMQKNKTGSRSFDSVNSWPKTKC